MTSFNPEEALNRDPNTRPAVEDHAGWLRFYAGGFRDADGVNRGWARGRWQYDNGCGSCHMQFVADELDRLYAIERGEAPR